MNNKEPEQLHEKTPAWFKEWRDKEFWHFKLRTEWRTKAALWLSTAILIALITGVVHQIFWG